MPKDAMIRARTDEVLKNRVEKIFGKLGLSSSSAINLFYKQVALQGGLPFEVKIPTKETSLAIKEASEISKGKFKTTKALFAELDA